MIKTRHIGQWRGSLPATAVAVLLLGGLTFSSSLPAQAKEDQSLLQQLQVELRSLQAQVDELQRRLSDAEEEKGAAAPQEERLSALEDQVAQAKREARAEELAAVKWHLAGYFSGGFELTDSNGSDSTFTPVVFNPVFHFMYRDWILFQGEVEFNLEEHGETEVELEYANVALLPTDYSAVIIGKYLSPIGQFQERLHATWVNKLPTAPAGYEHHGGIAPTTEIGVQVRGGVPVMEDGLFSYAAYVGNGPFLAEHHGRIEVLHEAVADVGDEKAYGGRLGFMPVPHLEFGVSALVADNLSGEGGLLTRPDYRLFGVDGAFTRRPWDVRFEYLHTELDGFVDADGDVAPEVNPNLWYAQAGYRIGNWEPVIRYGELEFEAFSTHQNAVVERETKRTTVGLNYVFTPSLIAKFAFENDSRDFSNDIDRWLFQIAYGF